MKMKVSRLFAVTLFTPKRIVRSSLPCRDGDEGGTVFPGRFMGDSGLPSLRALRLASLSRKQRCSRQTMKQAD